ncbi:MAG: radical SAM protein [Candidatus Fermentibacter sp.]|nr:radical SAM protein [Candidatus Fermentibacter sp.]
MPCVNRCWHCFCCGSPDGPSMEGSTVLRILDDLAALKRESGEVVLPMFYDEPTIHPEFVRIMGRQLDLGLIQDEGWFPTNGYGLARLQDEGWRELAEKGFEGIRLTFHGLGERHDRRVGRRGAYGDLVETVRRAERFGVEWFACMVLGSDNAAEYEETKAEVERLGSPSVKFGWMLPQSQGRAAGKGNRVKLEHIEHLLRANSGFRTESDHIRAILSDETLGGRKAFDPDCGMTALDIGHDLTVSFGGGCDGDPYEGLKSLVKLGNLESDSILECYRRYLENPPAPVRALSGVTWGELAGRYGDPGCDFVYHVTDLAGRIWASRYLRDAFPE